MFPPECQKTAALYHLSTTGGQPQPYTAAGTVTGAFLPMSDRSHALLGGDLIDPHEFYAEPQADVRVGDKLVIDAENYYVRRVFVAQFGGLAHKRASVSRDTHA